jgi:hypothetical protein
MTLTTSGGNYMEKRKWTNIKAKETEIKKCERRDGHGRR